jgi:signal transduction histidine kinase
VLQEKTTELALRQRDYIKKIKHSIRHLLNIINDILDFSKIEEGKLTIEHAEFDIIIRLKEQSDADVLIYCAVCNTGIGLTEEQMRRLFQRFSQCDTSTIRDSVIRA